MYPILLVLSLATAIAVDRWRVLRRSETDGAALWVRLQNLVAGDRLDEAVALCARSRGTLPAALGSVLGRMRLSESPEEARAAAEEEILESVTRLERRTAYLPTLANVATLLGLLGTIIGLIQSFQAISVADPSQKATLLAQGISVAMNTTAFGLIVAIPTMLAYAWLHARTTKIMDSLELYVSKLLNLLARSASRALT